MNKIFLIAVAFVSLAACNKKKEEEGREPVQAAPVEPARPAAGGSAGSAGSGGSAPDQAAVPSGTSAAEAVRPPSGGATTPTPDACATPSKLACAAGQVDGCAGGLTSVHACVAAGAKPGAPCAQGPALSCAGDAIDACGFAPPYASNHVCVVVPRPSP